MSKESEKNSESMDLTVQVLSWVYEHCIKYRIDDMSYEIEAMFREAKMRPDFFRGFPLLVRRLQLLAAEKTLENVEPLEHLLEDLLKIVSFQRCRRLYGTLIQLYVAAKLLNLHRKKCPSNEILNRFPLFNWEQIKTDFHLYDDFFKTHLKTYINDAHDIIRRDFSWSRCCLILSDQLLAELKGRLQTKVPKLLALLQQVFPNTALDKLAMDQDHCRRLLRHGVGAYSVLIKSLRNVDGKAKFTRESVEAVVRSLTLKRLPSSTTIDDSNAAKTILSESSSTPDFLWAENMKGRGPAHTPPSPRVTRSRSRSSSLGCRPKTSVGVSFPDTSKEESEFPKVVIKRNYVYVSGVEWPNGESKLDLSVKCDNKSSTVNKARSVSSRKMTLRSDGESKLDLSVKCDNESSTVNKARSVSSRKMTLRSDGESKLDLSVKCDNESSTVNKARSVSSRKMALRSGKDRRLQRKDKSPTNYSHGVDKTCKKTDDDSHGNLRLHSPAETNIEDSFGTSDESVSQRVPVENEFETRNVRSPMLTINGKEYPMPPFAPFHPLNIQGVHTGDSDTSEESEAVANLNVLRENVRNFDREKFLQIPGAACKSFEITVNSRKTVVDDFNYHPLNFGRYTGDCAAEYTRVENLPQGRNEEEEKLEGLISRVESVLGGLKEKLKKMKSAKHQGSLNSFNRSEANLTETSDESSDQENPEQMQEDTD
ncbi:uncharacterized protein [Palaemon carinicauda]|uniref:uncharacterized protein n=1 Tax=Palaemon carinicauda TaxID=392227 RepID=UPI0035B5844B